MFGTILDRLYAKYQREQEAFLLGKTGYGRAITGDGATILGTKFINFLCHEYGKGVMLCKIKDCTERLQEVGIIDAKFIAHEMIASIKYVEINCLLVMHAQIDFLLAGLLACVSQENWAKERLPCRN